jgi:very-short-patch-repair endonuclease
MLSDETIDEGAFFREKSEVAARMARFTESPIEILFGMAMMELIEADWALLPQLKWRGYRIDWALERPGRELIFIECDGNEFHTRPEHVARDRRRDHDIRRAGIKLFRFTGREIYRNAAGCALRVYLEARRPIRRHGKLA